MNLQEIKDHASQLERNLKECQEIVEALKDNSSQFFLKAPRGMVRFNIDHLVTEDVFKAMMVEAQNYLNVASQLISDFEQKFS